MDQGEFKADKADPGRLSEEKFAKKYANRLVGYGRPPAGELKTFKEGKQVALARVVGYLKSTGYTALAFLGGGGETMREAWKGTFVWTIEDRPEKIWVVNTNEIVIVPETSDEGTDEDSTEGAGGATNDNKEAAMSEDGGEEPSKKKKRVFKNVDVVYAASERIVLPEGMTYAQGREWLLKKEQELEKAIDLVYELEGYPMDAALAFFKALQKVYGFTSLVPTPGFFGDTPPAMIGVVTGLDESGNEETVQVPWGSMQISGIDGMLTTNFHKKDNAYILQISGTIRQKHRSKVEDIIRLTKAVLKEESIYKGHAIRVQFPEEGKKPDPLNAPKFMDLRRVNPDELVFSKKVQDIIETAVWTPIRATEVCRQNQIPLRRGTLLAGKYGTGKTLVASVTARICEENGWTFIYLSNVKDLPQAIHFAKMYQPAVVFAEDVNRVVGEERDEDVDKIFNTLDGVDTKHSEVMVIFTTNDIDKIHEGMMRPGRVDLIVPVTPPDGPAAQKLMRIYGRGLIPDGEDLTLAGEKLNGKIPAVVREVVERAKLAAARRLRENEPMVVLATDLEVAADSMVEHYKYLEPDAHKPPTDMERFGDIVGAHIVDGVTTALDAAGRAKTLSATANGASAGKLAPTNDA